MQMESLHDLFVDEIKDLWSAEKQILQALPKMIKAVKHKKLKQAFRDHLKLTREHVRRLERICKALDVSPRGKKCEGMEGLLKEGSGLIRERPEQDVLDAGLLSAAQHVEHYEMAGYGTVRTWAKLLGYRGHAAVLQRTLNEEGKTDHALTKLAEQSINIDADTAD
ncbi:MAG: ferritin-like domain-containing protein [Gemmatimonadota bacterium]